jgi:hypothetical protein
MLAEEHNIFMAKSPIKEPESASRLKIKEVALDGAKVKNCTVLNLTAVTYVDEPRPSSTQSDDLEGFGFDLYLAIIRTRTNSRVPNGWTNSNRRDRLGTTPLSLNACGTSNLRTVFPL